jgi:hypothetical protein
VNRYHCQLFFPDSNDLSSKDYDNLRDQGVNFDDWDFVLVVPPDQVEKIEEAGREWKDGDWVDVHINRLRPIGCYALSRFEIGCYANRWYLVDFRGEQVAMLVAYHA